MTARFGVYITGKKIELPFTKTGTAVWGTLLIMAPRCSQDPDLLLGREEGAGAPPSLPLCFPYVAAEL